MHITLIAGARPNFIKIAPLIHALQKAQADMIRNDRYPRTEIASMPRIQLFVGLYECQLCHFSGFLLIMHEP